MPDTCLVTFTARDSGFAVLPGQTITFVPTGALLAGQNVNLLARTTRAVVADGSGAGSVDLVPGTYRLETMGSDGLIAAPIIVPDVLTATIGECLDALAQASFSQMQVALLAASTGRMFETPALGYASAAVAVGDVFLALNAGVLSVYRKASPTTGTLLGPLFTTGSFGAGLTVNGLITGLAITQSTQDTTAGRLTKVGDFGLGAFNFSDLSPESTDLPTRFFRTNAQISGFGAGGHTIHLSRALNAQGAQIAVRDSTIAQTPLAAVRHRDAAGVWSSWNVLFGRLNLVGAVSQSAGVPTGGGMEPITNANGSCIRLADGTQICWRTNLSFANANTALGALFRSPDVTWTFPATFVSAPALAPGDVDDADAWMTTNGAPGTASASLRLLSAVSKGAALNARPVAIGRWF